MLLVHILHLWWLNQLSFGVVDMVLLFDTKMALQSFVTSLIAFRNFHRILMELDALYTEANALELKNLRDSEEVIPPLKFFLFALMDSFFADFMPNLGVRHLPEGNDKRKKTQCLWTFFP